MVLGFEEEVATAVYSKKFKEEDGAKKCLYTCRQSQVVIVTLWRKEDLLTLELLVS